MTFERLTPAERGVATPLGLLPRAPRIPPAGGSTRQALERVIADSVVDGPCYVLFSGGRDSSLILAMAVDAARRLGVADPLPVTAVYPGNELADESDWQDLVLAHLGIRERVVLSLSDERSTLGEVALRHLSRRGLVWPDSIQTQPLYFEQLDAGTVLTGEGGDAFLEARRITALHLLLRDRRLPSRALLRATADALSPTFLVRQQARRGFADPDWLPWLRPAAREVLAADEVTVRDPLRWDEAVWAQYHRRMLRMGLHNATVGAAEYGMVMRHPIAESAVVAALAHEGGRWGFRGRTNLFRRLGSHILPDAILARRGKAAFNASRWQDREREFAHDFSGGVFDPEFIDEQRLRRAWLSESPHPVSFLLAQIAWLHHEGLPLVPAATTSPIGPGEA